jgi:hypothetical protein
MDYFIPMIDHCRGPDKGISLHGRRKNITNQLYSENIVVFPLTKD